MFNDRWFIPLKKGLVLFCLSLMILVGFASTQVLAQTPSSLNQLCRQVNPVGTGAGPIAYYAPGGDRIRAYGDPDGPAAAAAIYLTSSPPEYDADKEFIRVWFESLEPNWKLGWIRTKTSSGDDMLKLGDSNWRAAECVK